MADHLRQQIREAVGTLIRDGDTDAGTNVHETRVFNLENTKLPAVNVYTSEDNIVNTTLSVPRTQIRIIDLTIECYAMGLSTSVDDSIDQLTKQVEILLMADVTLGSLVKDVKLKATKLDFDGEGKQIVGMAALSYEVTYAVIENRPDVAV